ncbi:MAG: hypothetical protein JRI68_10345 [Deltaproteobacteria bacterium]|nr:hypothetical protein [Deltaproteobacteria bacterium]
MKLIASFRRSLRSVAPSATLLGATGLLLTVFAGTTLLACDDDGDGGAGGATGGTGGTGGATTTTTTPTNQGGGGAGGSSSGTGGTGGQGGQGGEAPTGWYGTTPTLNNDADCLVWGGISPAAGEAGHLYAARLTPPSYPFQVTEVQYELMGSGECDNTFAHRVEVFVDSATTPPNSPTITLLDIAATGANETVRVVTAQLPSPITLQTGEHLFVAVELVTIETSCVAVCSNATVSDRDWWSNAVAVPYNWATLASFQFDVHARIGANGTAQ